MGGRFLLIYRRFLGLDARCFLDIEFATAMWVLI